MDFKGRDYGPRCRSRGIMPGQILPSRPRMPLTGWRGKQQVMSWHRCPVRLLEILAQGLDSVVGFVDFTSCLPVVCSPDHIRASHGRPSAKAASSSKKVDRPQALGNFLHSHTSMFLGYLPRPESYSGSRIHKHSERIYSPLCHFPILPFRLSL